MSPDPFTPPQEPTLKNAGFRSEFAATVRAIIQSMGAAVNLIAAITRALIRHGINQDPSETMTALNIARAQWNAIRAGAAMGDAPTTVPTVQPPRDSTIQPGTPRYHYGVLVTVGNSQGVVRSALVTVTSDTLLSASQAQQLAMQADTLSRQGRDYLLRIHGAGEEAFIEAQMMTAAQH